MISKRLTTVVLAVLCCLLTVGALNAQTFNGSTTNTAGNNLIPSVGTGGCTVAPQTTGGTIFNNTVAGLAATAGVATVQINLTHTWDADLDIFLQAPNGQRVELSTFNGGAGDNYTNTVFSDAAAISITAGTPPFTGTFRPEATVVPSTCGLAGNILSLAAFTPAQNGIWQLIFQDNTGGDSGVMLGWSITFAPVCGFVLATLPNINLAGTNPAVCGLGATNFTAPLVLASCPVGTTVGVSVNGVAQAAVAPGVVFPVTGLPTGVNTIRFTVNGQALVQTVIVTDAVAPVITCPSNVTINLDPGACNAVFNFAVGATDNCPFFGPVATASFPLPANLNAQGAGAVSFNGNNLPGGTFFNLTNNSATALRVTGFSVRFGDAQFGVVPSPQPVSVYYTTVANTYVGNTGNPAAFTLAGTVLVPVNGTMSAYSPFTLPTPINLAPGQTRGIYVFGNVASVLFENFGTSTATPQVMGPLTLMAGQASAALFDGQTAFQPISPNVQVAYQVQGPIVATQTTGLGSGATFPTGTTVNTFTATDAAGNVATCSFSVVVAPFLNAITALACNDLIYYSLDPTCSGTINASQILEGGPYRCFDTYVVELDRTAPFGNGPWTPAVVGAADINRTYQVRVTDPVTGNRCWGNITIQDKLPPVLTCPPFTIPCNASNLPGASFPSNTSFTGTTPAFATADAPATTSRTIPINSLASQTITDVNVGFTTNHTWIGDLVLRVTSPAGTTVILAANNPNCAGDGENVVFDSQAATPFATYLATCGNNPAIAGTFQPQNSLSVFNGQSAAGNWTVSVQDRVGGDVSTATTFTLNITVNPAPANPFPNGLLLNVNVFQTGPATYIANAGTLDACTQTTLTYIDTETPLACASGLVSTISRKYTAVDGSGNTATCIQIISLQRPTLADVVLPPNFDNIQAPAFNCLNGAFPTPTYIQGLGLQGFPTVFGLPAACNINYGYVDLVIPVCDGTYKIARTWTIIDWCTGTTLEFLQIIKVLDSVGPTIACPANLTVSTDPFQCCATVNLPDVIVTDNCSRINNIRGMVVTFDQFTGTQTGMFTFGGSMTTFPGNNLWDRDTLAAFGFTPCLPLGLHTVTYIAEDDCGNTSSCTFQLRVADLQPPVPSCDQTTTVGINTDDPFDCYLPANGCDGAGVTRIPARNFNDGSYDNCNQVFFTVVRMQPYSDCILGLNPTNGHPDCFDIFPDPVSEFTLATQEDTFIKFYCCEVGTTQMVRLRVYQLDPGGFLSVGLDGGPIYNDCMISVEVQDKIVPVCQSPINVTVSCTNFDPSLWAYGRPTVFDNCCLDTTRNYQGQCGLTQTANYSLFDTVCNRGTITRTFRVFDCHGLQSQCTQRVVVTYLQDYFVKFPADQIVTVCDGTGNFGEPTFFNEDCELLGSSFEDQIFTVVPDACYKIERTWTVINWCTYNPNAGCVEVPNPNPNATVNSPQNLPGVTISALGNTVAGGHRRW